MVTPAMGCSLTAGWSFARMSTCVAVLAFALAFFTPSTCQPVTSVSLRDRVLELLREPFAAELLRQSQLGQNSRDSTVGVYTEDSTDSEPPPTLGGDVEKRPASARWRALFGRPSRRGRLSIGMTLDALSDMLSAERRRHYRLQALRAQKNLHKIGKRDVMDAWH